MTVPSPRTIMLTAADGFQLPVYEVQPAGTPRGAVVVLQEIFGVNSHIRAVTESFAQAGYLALAPALFQRVRAGVELGYTQPDIAEGMALKAAAEALPAPGALQDVQACLAHAVQAGKVGVVGYCWGGLMTWRSACLLDGVHAAVPYYGGGVTSATESARQPRCPVLAHFGRQDHAIPLAGVEAFAKAHPEVRVELYDAGHGFHCDQRGSFDAVAAALARERTLAFFAKYLG